MCQVKLHIQSLVLLKGIFNLKYLDLGSYSSIFLSLYFLKNNYIMIMLIGLLNIETNQNTHTRQFRSHNHITLICLSTVCKCILV